MSVANDYANVADWVAGYAHRNEPIPPVTASHLALCLLDLAERVRRIEQVPLRLDSPEIRLGFHRIYEAPDVS